MGEKTKRTAKKSVFPSDAEWGMAMRDAWGLPQIARSNTDAIRGAFIKKHGYHRCARMGLFTDCLLLLRCLPLGFDALSARQIDTDFSHAESNMYGSMPHDGACLIRGRSV